MEKDYTKKDLLFSEASRYIRIPLFKPYWSLGMFFEKNARENVIKYLKKEFNKDAILTDSGSSAIKLALKLNNKQGEVVIPSFACKSVINSVLSAECTPVFYDITNDFGPNIDSIKRCLTDKTIAVIAVHQYGIIFDLKYLKQLCVEKNLCLIEDSAIVFDKKATIYGDYTIFSFNIGKEIVSFGGGALLSNNIKKIELPENHLTFKTIFYYIVNIYFKKQLSFLYYILIKANVIKKYTNVLDLYNKAQYSDEPIKTISNLQAKVTWYQIKNIDQIKKNCKKVLDIYSQKLSLHKSISTVYSPITIESRYELSNYLSKLGIETQWTFFPLHLQNKYNKYQKDNLANTEYLWKKELSVPINPRMTEKDALCIVESINKFYSKDYQEEVKRYYKDHADTYQPITSQWRIDLLKKYNSIEKIVLDIGCGTGNYIIKLPNNKKFGIDISKESLDVLRKRNNLSNDINIIESDILEYSPNDKFDLIYSFSTLYYIKEIDVAISKISQMMNGDGIAILEFGNKYSINSIWDRLIFSCPQFHFSQKEIKKIMANNGLAIEKILYRQLIPNFKGLFDKDFITGPLEKISFRMIFVIRKK